MGAKAALLTPAILLFLTENMTSFVTNYAYFQTVMLHVVKNSMGLVSTGKVPVRGELAALMPIRNLPLPYYGFNLQLLPCECAQKSAGNSHNVQTNLFGLID